MPTDHLAQLIQRLPELAACRDSIAEAYTTLHRSFRTGHKVLLCGNGGSAADADHWAGELLKGFSHPRPLSASERRGLPTAVARRLQGALPAIPLTGFPAATTAFGNDVDPELAFAQLTSALGRKGDVLVAISTSGNSPSILNTIEMAKTKGMQVVGMTGESGGKMKDSCDLLLNVPSVDTPRIQESHILIGHIICLMVEKEMFGNLRP